MTFDLPNLISSSSGQSGHSCKVGRKSLRTFLRYHIQRKFNKENHKVNELKETNLFMKSTNVTVNHHCHTSSDCPSVLITSAVDTVCCLREGNVHLNFCLPLFFGSLLMEMALSKTKDFLWYFNSLTFTTRSLRPITILMWTGMTDVLIHDWTRTNLGANNYSLYPFSLPKHVFHSCHFSLLT